MREIDSQASTLAGRNEDIDAPITLRGLFTLLTGSIRTLFDARFAQEERRRIKVLHAHLKWQNRRFDDQK